MAFIMLECLQRNDIIIRARSNGPASENCTIQQTPLYILNVTRYLGACKRLSIALCLDWLVQYKNDIFVLLLFNCYNIC